MCRIMPARSWPRTAKRRRKFDGKTKLESREYAVSGAGGDGRMPTAGREAKYYHDCLGGNDLQLAGDALDFGAAGAVFL